MSKIMKAKANKTMNISIADTNKKEKRKNDSIQLVNQTETLDITYDNTNNIFFNIQELEKRYNGEIINFDRDILKKYDLKKENIQKITINENEIIIIYTNSQDNMNYTLVFNNENLELNKIKLENGQELGYIQDKYITDEYTKFVQNETLLKEGTNLLGAIPFPNTEKFILWGEGKTFEEFLKMSSITITCLEKYPKNIKEYIINQDNFLSVYIVNNNTVELDLDFDWAAFCHKTNSELDYMFIDETGELGLIHEFAHLFDEYYGGEQGPIAESDADFIKLYEKYNKEFHDFLGKKYPGHYNGPAPNSREFFANIVPIYLLDNQDLYNNYPELQQYISKLFNNI